MRANREDGVGRFAAVRAVRRACAARAGAGSCANALTGKAIAITKGKKVTKRPAFKRTSVILSTPFTRQCFGPKVSHQQDSLLGWSLYRETMAAFATLRCQNHFAAANECLTRRLGSNNRHGRGVADRGANNNLHRDRGPRRDGRRNGGIHLPQSHESR